MDTVKVLLFYRLLSLEQMFSVTLTEQLHPPIRKEWTCLWICGRCPCWSLEHCLGSWAPTLFLCWNPACNFYFNWFYLLSPNHDFLSFLFFKDLLINWMFQIYSSQLWVAIALNIWWTCWCQQLKTKAADIGWQDTNY